MARPAHPFRIGDSDRQPGAARAAGGDRQLVRAPAGPRHGAGLAVSEMVSSFGIHYGNERTLNELLRLHPEEHPVSVQLFGQDPEVMRSAAATVAEAGADLIDINMGCPVRRSAGPERERRCFRSRAGAGDRRGAREGAGVPVTVKVRSGLEPGQRQGYELAIRLVDEAGVAAIGFHPRARPHQHKGTPDYALTRELVAAIDAPVIVSGGLDTADAVRRAYEDSGAAAVMIARGALGNPWIFEELTGPAEPPSREQMVAELLWVMDRAEEHLGADRAARYLRKFYPWYLDRMDAPKGAPAGHAVDVRRDRGAGRSSAT